MKKVLLVSILALSTQLAIAETNTVAQNKKKAKPAATSTTAPVTPQEDATYEAPRTATQTSMSEMTDRSMNIYVNPLGFLLGAANVAFEWKLADSLSLGPTFAYSRYTSGTTTATGLGFGLTASFFLGNSALTDSWFFSPFLNYATASLNSASVSGIATGADIGYWWFWDSGINLSLGFGVQYISFNLASIGIGGLSSILPSARFSFGYSF